MTVAPWLSEPETTETSPEATNERSWSDVPGEAYSNLGKSAVQFGKDLIQPVLHPIDTAKSLYNLNEGAHQYLQDKVGPAANLSPTMAPHLAKKAYDWATGAPEEDNRPAVDAVGKFLADRYGGMDALKKTMAEDPVGFLSDASMILTGGGAAAAKAPGMAGKIGQAVNTAGHAIDPITIATKPIELAGSVAGRIASEGAGLATGAGGKAVDAAFNAGHEGGVAAKEFRDNMRGKVPQDDVISDAQNAVRQMRIDRGLDYGVGMAVFNLANQGKVLNFNRIDNAIQNAGVIKRFKGRDLDPATAAIRDNLDNIVAEWKSLPPKDYHTLEGFDAMKQEIGSIRDATQYGTPERVVADRYYNAVRKEILNASPQYGKIMKGYEDASNVIREVEKTLSISPEKGKGPLLDTTLRKLQSILRNNVNTNYGRREKLAEYLKNAGAPHLIEALAGQALNTWTPRGLHRMVGAGELAASMGALMMGNPKLAGVAAAAAAGSSPRLVGESAYYAGRAAKPAGMVYDAAKAASPTMFQAGRLADEIQGRRYGGAVRAIARAKAR